MVIPSRGHVHAPVWTSDVGPASRNARHRWCPKEHHTRRRSAAHLRRWSPCGPTDLHGTESSVGVAFGAGGSVRRGIRRIPEANSGSERAASNGNGAHLTIPQGSRTDDRACNGMQERSDGDAGHHQRSVRPKGMTGRRPRRGTRPREGRPTGVLNQTFDGTDPPAEQSLEGPRPFDTTTAVRLETESSRRSRIGRHAKSEEARGAETRPE